MVVQSEGTGVYMHPPCSAFTLQLVHLKPTPRFSVNIMCNSLCCAGMAYLGMGKHLSYSCNMLSAVFAEDTSVLVGLCKLARLATLSQQRPCHSVKCMTWYDNDMK